MAFLVKKTIYGKQYYYAVQTQTKDGKSCIVWQKYLGKAEDIIESVQRTTIPKPKETISYNFGAVAALWDLARRLNVIEIIDQYVQKRNQRPTVGEYMLVASINRCICPKSKQQIGDWYEKTILPRLLGISKDAFSSQHFWNNMNLIGKREIESIEKELALRLINDFKVDLRCLIYDTTNFFTYFSPHNESEFAQRGRNKDKHHGLRQIGLALLVSTDFHIPFLHTVYPGNIHDSVEFKVITEELVKRYEIFSKNCQDITVVYDKGNNSLENQELIDNSRYHFIGSLTPTQYSDLLRVPLSKYETLKDERLEGVKAYRSQREVLGCQRTVIVTYSEELFLEHSYNFFAVLKKRIQQIKQIKKQLNSKDRKLRVKKNFKAIQREMNKILATRYLHKVLIVNLTKKSGKILLSYKVDHEQLNYLEKEVFGKTIIFTDQDSWTTEEIVLGYRNRNRIETAFRHMKNPHFISFKPMFHWTDQKIRVHAFYCVLALMLSSILQRELYNKGIHLSISTLMETLSEIKEEAVVYAGKNDKEHVSFTHSRLDETQKLLFQTLRLEHYLFSSKN